MARWHTLHEIAVVVSFLSEHGESCAKRYLAHESVERFRAASKYLEFADQLGFVPLTTEEFDAVRAARDAALHEYGDAFDREYGWAATFVGNQHQPKFAGDGGVAPEGAEPSVADHRSAPRRRGLAKGRTTCRRDHGLVLLA